VERLIIEERGDERLFARGRYVAGAIRSGLRFEERKGVFLRTE